MPTRAIKMQRLVEALSEHYRRCAHGLPVDLGSVRAMVTLAEELDLDRKDLVYLINYGELSAWRVKERRMWERDRDRTALALPDGGDEDVA